MMATLVTGLFYLSLDLNTALVGLVMSVGPLFSALPGISSGRIVDRFSSNLIVIIDPIIGHSSLFHFQYYQMNTVSLDI